jgi:YHS domain-containing protein
MKQLKQLTVALALIACFMTSACMATSAQAGKISSDANGVALQGYDLVSYFTAHQAVRGSKANAVEHDGSTFYFASAENSMAFKKNPKQYLPKYDGYCAFAVAKNMKRVPSDPNTFKIVNGELLLFFNDFYQGQVVNTIVPWNQNEATMSASAERNWKNMSR